MPTLHRRSAGLAAMLLVAQFLMSACTSNEPPQVQDARVILPPPGMSMAAGYFQLKNRGSSPLRLQSISSPAFDSVEMHETVIEQGVSRMRALDTVEIAAGASLRFEPGGRHLMMFGPQKNLELLSEIPMTLVLVGPDGHPTKLRANFAVEHAGEHVGEHDDHASH